MLGIAWIGRIRQVEYGDPVKVRVIAEQRHHFIVEARVGGGQLQVGSHEQAQFDLVGLEERAGGQSSCSRRLSFLGQAVALETADAGVLIAIEGIGPDRRGTRHHEQRRQTAQRAHHS